LCFLNEIYTSDELYKNGFVFCGMQLFKQNDIHNLDEVLHYLHLSYASQKIESNIEIFTLYKVV